MAASRSNRRPPLTGARVAGRRRLGLVSHRSSLRRWRAGDGLRATPPLDQLPLGRPGRWPRRRRRYGLVTADEPLIPRAATPPRRPSLLARHHLALGIPAARKSVGFRGETPDQVRDDGGAVRRRDGIRGGNDARGGRRLFRESAVLGRDKRAARRAQAELPTHEPQPKRATGPRHPGVDPGSLQEPEPGPTTQPRRAGPGSGPGDPESPIAGRAVRLSRMFPVSRTAAPRQPLAHRPESVRPVRSTPSAPAEPARQIRPVHRPPEPPLPPEQAWRAATAEQPLENPRPLPASWQPLARRLAGTPNVRYTTGPATRAALAASGALGATTARVIHLAREPVAADTEVVAHELVHAGSPLVRPRFLAADHRHGDADEQVTRQVTSQALAVTRPAPEVARLPVGGSAVLVARAPAAAHHSSASAVQPGVATPGQGTGVLARDSGPARSAPTAAEAQAPTDPAGQAGAPIDYDKLIGFLDRWLGKELERRGGRYQGVF